MPHWIEPLEPRQLLSAFPHGAHSRAAHRLDVKTTQVDIEARLVQADLKTVKQLGVQWLSTAKKEVQQIGAALKPVSASNKPLLDQAVSTASSYRELVADLNREIGQDKQAVNAVLKSYTLFLNHPGDSFAQGKFSSAVDTLSSTKGALNGLLGQVPGAQQQIELMLTPIVNANGSIQTRVDAAIANMDAKQEAVANGKDQLSNDTDQLLSAAETALQSP